MRFVFICWPETIFVTVSPNLKTSVYTEPCWASRKLLMGSRKIFKKKSLFWRILKKKFNEIDFEQEEPYWSCSLRSPGASKVTSNMALEEKREIRQSKKLTKIKVLKNQQFRRKNIAPYLLETLRPPPRTKQEGLHTSFSPSRSLCRPFCGLYGSTCSKIHFFWGGSEIFLWGTQILLQRIQGKSPLKFFWASWRKKLGEKNLASFFFPTDRF